MMALFLFPSNSSGAAQSYNFIRLSRRALDITDTELKLMATAAIIGDNNNPTNGYNIPAAIGTPSEL